MSDECLMQAFDVELPNNFDPSEIPCDGHSYLQSVMYEASQCPDVVVADLSKLEITSNFWSECREGSERPRIPAMMMLSLEDQLEEVAEFSKVRQKVARERAKIPNLKPRPNLPQDLNSWHTFCFGGNSRATDNDGLEEGTPPLFSILVSLSQCEILELLDHHVEYLDSRPTLSRRQAEWIYSLLVFTELPLLPDTFSTLRTLARACSRIRESIETIHDVQLPALHLFICLVARYFNQCDIGDNPHSAGDM